MNKKGISVLIPFFTILMVTLLAFAVIQVFNLERQEEFQVPIGDRQETVLELYQYNHAIHTYAKQAAKIALARAINKDPLGVSEQTNHEFQQVMIKHPDHRIIVDYTVSRTQNTISIESETPIVVSSKTATATSLQESSTATTPQPSQHSSGAFDMWPVDQEPAVLTSLFGFRTVSRGSTAHPAIDIFAPQGTPVYSLQPGTVLRVREDYVLVKHTNGWTCAYFHIIPQASANDAVRKGDVLGTVYYPGAHHLDLRCFNHQQPLTVDSAKELFPDSVASSTDAPKQNTPLFAIHNSMGVWTDPFCLFTPDLQQQMVRSQQQRRDSGLAWASAYPDSTSVPDDEVTNIMYQTCEAYAQTGILDTRSSLSQTSDTTAQAFVNALIDHTISEIEQEEFTITPEDRGGPTRYGITQDTLSAYRGEQASVDDVRLLTQQEARQIYAEEFYFTPRINMLSPDIIPVVFDAGVNQGVGSAAQFLRDVLRAYGSDIDSGTTITQEVADKTQEIIVQEGAEEFINAYVDRRIQRYESIIENDPTQQEFWCGWLRRAESFRPQNHASDVFRAQGCAEQPYYSTLGESHVAGDAWRGIVRSMHQAPEYVYRFFMRVSVDLTQEQAAELRAIENLHNVLRLCPANDTDCLERALRNAHPAAEGFAYCQDYQTAFSQAIDNCQEHFLQGTDCACPVPLPHTAHIERVRWNAQEVEVVRTDGSTQTFSAHWLSFSGDIEDSIKFLISLDSAETARSADASTYFTWSAEDTNMLSPELSYTPRSIRDVINLQTGVQIPSEVPIVFDNVMWVTNTPQSVVALGAENILTVAPHSTLPACQNTLRIERTYCREKEDGTQQFNALVRVKPTPPPEPQDVLVGIPGISFEDFVS